MRWLRILSPAALLTALIGSIAASPVSAGFTLVRSYDGLAAGGEFGYACAVIGDMDGDGIGEFAIGAPGDDSGGENAGRVFIYRGGHPLLDDPAWVITGAPGERLGHALAVSYVDGDQVPDLVIGAPGSPGAPATMTGRMVVAYGGNPLGARPLASVPGTTTGGRFGWAVEGFRYGSLQILVSAPEANDGAGEVHGFAGGDPPPASRLFVLHGEAAGELFGYAVSNAGITRGAIGGPEFLVGAPEAAGNGPSSGRFALYLHDAPDDTLPDLAVSGVAGARLGQSIAGGLDTNPNFFEPSDDIVVGAPGADLQGLSDAGNALVYVDGAQFSYTGGAAQASLGSTVRMLRDAAGSYLPDLAVGEAGAVRFYTGPLKPGSGPVATLLAESAGDGFGHAISNGGRIDPSFTSRDQFLIGAPDYAGHGRVYVYTDLSVPTGVDPPWNPPVVRLGAPTPNPSRGAFSFWVVLPRDSRARLTVIDLAGREIATLHDGPLGYGWSAHAWTPSRAQAAGIYFAVLDVDGARTMRRMIRVR